MGKFKVGDKVITRRFEDDVNGLRFVSEMHKRIGKAGTITGLYETARGFIYKVHDWNWHESALELVESRSLVTIQASTTDIRVILGKDTFDVWESDSLVVGFTPEEITEIFTAMQAFK